jgi:hypothetical protein
VLLAACGNAARAPAAAPIAAVAPDAAIVVPDADDSDLPGHYAVLVEVHLDGSHNMQWVSADSTPSMVLELADDGAATMCFGVDSVDTTEGDNVDRRFALREQRGYRGTYTGTVDAATLTLMADDAVCATIEEAPIVLDRPASFEFSCARGDADGHPALRCRPTHDDYVFLPYFVTELAPSTIVLGPGAGLSIGLTGRPEPGYFGGEPRAYTIEQR